MSVRDMTDGWYIYTDQIPNLLFALLVLLVGWLIAKGIGKSVEAALKRTSFDDKLFANVGKRNILQKSLLEKLFIISYW